MGVASAPLGAVPRAARQAVLGIGLVRLAVGAAILARPASLARGLGVDRGSAERTAVVARLFAGRELALGAGTLVALERCRRGHGGLALWLGASMIADGGDALALADALRRRQSPPVRSALLAAAGAVGVGAAAVALWASRPSRPSRPSR